MKLALTLVSLVVAILLTVAMLFTSGWQRPPVETEQQGYRGTGMVKMDNPALVKKLREANKAPDPVPAVPAGGPSAASVYKNVKVLNDLSVGEFTRLMVAVTAWVSPEQGCNYCHVPTDLADDSLYTKVVARKMIEMTRHINTDWKTHTGETGVTCYTCHRGQPVPKEMWTALPDPDGGKRYSGNRAGQNAPSKTAGLTSLPGDPFSSYLGEKGQIRVAANKALPDGQGASIQATEGTYSLMMHLSKSLGVNCTHCHNSRAFSSWEESNPARLTAYKGIEMVLDLNKDYLSPLAKTLPAERLGALGDAPKANCATCHQGAPKPLLGAAMIKDHPELVGPLRAAAPAAKPAAVPAKK